MATRQIQVLTNSFPITQIPTKQYFMYDVVFLPEVKQDPKRKQLFHHLQTTVAPAVFNPRLIYDGRAIAYSPGKMNLGGNSGATFNVMLGRNDQPPQAQVGARGVYQIRINLTSSAPIDPNDVRDVIRDKKITQRSTTATNVIQLIIRQGPNQHYTNNGRAYFTGKEAMPIQGAGIELWRGIFQSVRPTLGQMVLTIDTSTAAVYKSGPLINVAMDFLQARDIRDLQLAETDANFKKLDKFLKKLRIKVVTGAGGTRSRIKTIRGLVPNGGDYMFYKEDQAKNVTVAQHFHEAYGIRINHTRIVGISLSGQKGSGNQDIVPMELCDVEYGQLYKHKISENVTRDMVKFSTMRPKERLAKIVAGVADYNRSEYVVESGMKVDTRPMMVKAGVLPTPQVEYGGQNRPNVRDGAWNVLGQTFYQPAALASWAMVNFCPNRVSTSLCEKIVGGILESCAALGMGATPPHVVHSARGNDVIRELESVMENIARRIPDPAVLGKTILMIILPQNAAPIRSEVKRWGDTKRGIPTQCLREQKVSRANNQYYNNVALKLNARLGGKNSRGFSPTMAKLQQDPFIIMGADVGHPGPGVQKPSVTSLVYSHDNHATQYAAITDIQAPRTEIIADLRAFVREAVDSWGQKNRVSPKRIIFFRDGVSEGEFEKVSKAEIEEIRAAIKEVWEHRKVVAPLPLITFIVVGKRHHAVFFPADGQGDRTGNCSAGSVIDSQITHPATIDFYLQSHSAIQGTCRSSHYIVLENENKFSLPEIQELAYTLCHVYAKATRSVSIPAPVYYADLVCTRGPFHIDPSASYSFDDGMSVSSGPTVFELDNWKSAFQPTNPRLGKAMYYL